MQMNMAMIALAVLASGTTALAQTASDAPPLMGVCQPLESDNVGAVTKVTWAYDASAGEGSAKIAANYGDEYEGTVVGMRPHIDWFKFSIRFTDRFDKLNELTVFHAVGDYRMGVVSFDIVEEERYVSSITPFQTAQCLVQ